MTKSELAGRIAAQHRDVRGRDVDLVIQVILDALSEALESGRRVEIREFGSFNCSFINAKAGRNPMNGEVVHVPSKRRIRFKPGKALRERVTLPMNF
jgi:integration host factor subunit beta